MTQQTPLQQLLYKLKSVFPEAVTETQRAGDDGKPYYVYALKEEFIEQLKDEGLAIANDQNRYELQFPSKNTAKAQATVPSYKTLVADKEQSKDFDNTGNLFIEGDNLDALRMLQQSYRDKIKVIYIDPPYNTGSDDFVYNDDFSVKQKAYLQAAGILDEDGEKQISELQNGLRGRFHAGWLAFMYPRLKLARELLRDDGVIFISIDDNEQANLKLICDEIFGEENFYTKIIWTARNKPMNAGTARFKFQSSDEYVFCYGKISMVDHKPFLLESSHNKEYPYVENNLHYRLEEIQQRKNIGVKRSEKMVFDIPGTKLNDNYRWTIGLSTLKKLEETKRLIVLKKTAYRKIFRTEESNEIYYPLWSNFAESVGTSEEGKADLFDLMAGVGFDTVKPIELIKKLCFHFCNSNEIIFDFFAGSATTAHAVMQLNAEDGGKRKFILVQWAEEINAKKSREAHTFCTETLKRPANIAEIAKERIRRAGAKILADNHDKQIDTGFRAFSVRDSLLSNDERQPLYQTPQKELSFYKTELVRSNFEPLLYEVLLKTGVTLDLPLAVHEVQGYPFAICDRRCYCVTKNLTQLIVQQITEQHGDAFDILYYLSDCPKPTTSYTELESAIRIASKDKQIQILSIY